ncbi:hypothetical protein BS78_07G112300 [Paspalum vaginatum]|nr:hypothetical protein BS78_07G112300 [Paspalum vaginatum]
MSSSRLPASLSSAGSCFPLSSLACCPAAHTHVRDPRNWRGRGAAFRRPFFAQPASNHSSSHVDRVPMLPFFI